MRATLLFRSTLLWPRQTILWFRSYTSCIRALKRSSVKTRGLGMITHEYSFSARSRWNILRQTGQTVLRGRHLAYWCFTWSATGAINPSLSATSNAGSTDVEKSMWITYGEQLRCHTQTIQKFPSNVPIMTSLGLFFKCPSKNIPSLFRSPNWMLGQSPPWEL